MVTCVLKGNCFGTIELLDFDFKKKRSLSLRAWSVAVNDQWSKESDSLDVMVGGDGKSELCCHETHSIDIDGGTASDCLNTQKCLISSRSSFKLCDAFWRNLGQSMKTMKFHQFLAQSNVIYSATEPNIKNRFFAFSPQFSPLSVGASFIWKGALVFSKIWRHLISTTLLYIIDRG